MRRPACASTKCAYTNTHLASGEWNAVGLLFCAARFGGWHFTRFPCFPLSAHDYRPAGLARGMLVVEGQVQRSITCR